MKKNVLYATAILIATFTLISCQKENTPIPKDETVVPKKDLADYFVGTYSGNFREETRDNLAGLTSATYLHFILASVTKQSADQVTFQVENTVNKRVWRFTGFVRDSLRVDLANQNIDGQDFSNLGTAYRSFKVGSNECDTAGLDPKVIKFAFNAKLTFQSKYTTVAFYGQK